MNSNNIVVEGEKELKIAVVGCSHGHLDIIYDTLRRRESDFKTKIDVLLCCGDFQAMRNEADLAHFHCPEKYRSLGDFHKYYSGENEAPCLTIFIGGNHENSAFSMELPHGGWVAKNIYYMGFASVVNFGGLRIGGWSGIFKPGDYPCTHSETLPFHQGQQISAYHVRSVEMFRLGLLADKKPNCVDVFMTHDWPVGITSYGNEEQLIRFKPHFEKDIKNNQLGNPYSRKLVHEIRPNYWFAGHMHCKFEAIVRHEKSDDCETEGQTNFLALHKCDHRRMNNNFFDIRTIKVNSTLSNELRYDPKWLAILRKTTELETAQKGLSQIPADSLDYMPSDEDLKKVDELFEENYVIPLDFRRTATPQHAYKKDPKFFGAHYYRNPQTKEFCERLQIPDLNKDLCMANMAVVGDPFYLSEGQSTETKTHDEGEIVLNDDDIFGDDDFVIDVAPAKSRKRPAEDDEEERGPSGDKKARLND